MAVPNGTRVVNRGIRKRPRYLTSWEDSFRKIMNTKRQKTNDDLPSRKRDKNKSHHLGLIDLFGDNRWTKPKASSRKQRETFVSSARNTKPFGFFTLRTEHRIGGPLARYPGEERVLLFRSDRPGAIAKIVFSSSPVALYTSQAESSVPASITTTSLMNHKSQKLTTVDIEKEQNLTTANATIHVLFVKDTYRGFNLGGLLFALCTAYLRERYRRKKESDFGSRGSCKILSTIHCRLDAEEDVRRHNRLVHFYEHLGCRKRTRAKVTFINNNDGEIYRRVPMMMDLLLSPYKKESPVNRNQNHIATVYSSFLPVLLTSSSGETARVGNQANFAWLIAECKDGNIELGTTDGKVLRIDDKGRCRLVSIETISMTCSPNTGTFRLFRVSDELDKVVYDREDEDYFATDKLDSRYPPQQRCATHLVHQKELWMMRSTLYGTFLGMASDHSLVLSKTARFWQANENFCLTHTFDSPARRQHHRRMWKTQCVAYVSEMRERYGHFNLFRESLEGALTATRDLPANPFSVLAAGRREPETTTPHRPSLRTLLFHTAEQARKEGHPDWVQLLALVHGLAAALTCLGPMVLHRSTDHSPDDTVLSYDNYDGGNDFDWTIYVDARVIGCKALEDSTFAEFRHLNPDQDDARYSTTNGLYKEHIGLENVLLSWTGSDYMYSMLQYNQVRLPHEAYMILKLFPLVDWHSRGKHTFLSNAMDEELKPFVADIYDLFRHSRIMVLSRDGDSQQEMSDKECQELWTNHYSAIAQKYGAGDILEW